MTKILLVEDDKSLREIYGVRLLAEGYDIISAGDGEEALAMAIKDRPALIVSDVMMPKISGFDMLDILRSTTETKDIKVIMMTALSSEDQRKRGESLGADRYLVKSQVGIEDVVRTVHEVLGDAPGTVAPTQVASTPRQPVTPGPSPQPTPTGVSIHERSVPNSAPTAPADVAPTPLPQPTAPFSTPRPAGLGDRVIQPLERPAEPDGTSIADRMDQALSVTPGSIPISPVPEPGMPAPQPISTPANIPTPPQPITPTQPPIPTPVPSSDPKSSDDDSSVDKDEAAITAELSFEETPRTATVAPASPSTDQLSAPTPTPTPQIPTPTPPTQTP